MKNTNHSTSGFTLTELLVSISIIGTLLGILLPVLAIAKAKANRIKCVNNLGQLGKASLAFATDNSERMPWQLTPFAKRAHFGSHDPFSTTAIVSLLAMKSELGTAKILASPCDAEAQGPNEAAQANWETYDARQGRNISCPAVSYRFIEGGNTGRPGTMLAMLRNFSTDDLATGTLVGLIILTAPTFSAELTPKESRQFVRQPYGTKIVIDRKYDGWITEGDLLFYNRVVKHLKIIEKGAPEMYAVGQKNVDIITSQVGSGEDGQGSGAWPKEKRMGIGVRDLNYIHRSLVTYVLMHEFQHCDPRDGSEGAACWTAVMYGKQTGVHPCLIKFYRGVAIGPHGYSQAKWDATHRK